jgi:hypothetical protein
MTKNEVFTKVVEVLKDLGVVKDIVIFEPEENWEGSHETSFLQILVGAIPMGFFLSDNFSFEREYFEITGDLSHVGKSDDFYILSLFLEAKNDYVDHITSCIEEAAKFFAAHTRVLNDTPIVNGEVRASIEELVDCALYTGAE